MSMKNKKKKMTMENKKIETESVVRCIGCRKRCPVFVVGEETTNRPFLDEGRIYRCFILVALSQPFGCGERYGGFERINERYLLDVKTSDQMNEWIDPDDGEDG
jgi:hypothetical protein